MRVPYWRDDHTTLHLGDARDVLSEMPDRSVDCLVTSPPYYGLRDYGPGQYGQEPTPDDYVENLRATFAEARRVLANDGTCWLNLGDVYAANSDGSARGTDYNQRQPVVRPRSRRMVPPKNLLGMPWRVAFALQRDGWILRNAIVWSKPNAMPQSALDRLSTRYELIFLLVKQRFYWFDLDAIREQYTGDRSLSRRARRGGIKPNAIQRPWPRTGMPKSAGAMHGTASRPNGRATDAANPSGRNPGDVWTISTKPYRGAHFAPSSGGSPRSRIRTRSSPAAMAASVFAVSRAILAAPSWPQAGSKSMSRPSSGKKRSKRSCLRPSRRSR
ncbi:site-specific DNA-methyltransferase [Microbispora triticiradicis]|uniref:Methyltransferase n=1 Tax=Microbispora triticiradicis TaxID=2200763 RepID=A0ABX9LKU9_9ACTN|nr:site-specific DNA-methyltransferase [Microbispora triticiradicis]RGA04584.1 site-specific DNA-methyltransferase [Microbispora triticiradicis]GLW25594.1 methyltransferase [Microbispora amethystogenes]